LSYKNRLKLESIPILVILCNFSHTQGNLNYTLVLSNTAPNTLSLLKNESVMWEIITPKDSFNYSDKVHSVPIFVLDITQQILIWEMQATYYHHPVDTWWLKESPTLCVKDSANVIDIRAK